MLFCWSVGGWTESGGEWRVESGEWKGDKNFKHTSYLTLKKAQFVREVPVVLHV